MQLTVGTKNAEVRNKWVVDRLSEVPSGFKLLDAGAGEQIYRKNCEHLKYFAQDFASYDGQGDGKGLQTGRWDQSNLDFISDITNIPVERETFDVVLCTEVFEHLPEPVAALREFARILKPGGRVIITAPFASLTHFAPFHFATGFNRYFYEYHLGKFGFDKIKIDYNGNFFEFLAQEIRRAPEISEKYSGIKFKFFDRLILKQTLKKYEQLSTKCEGSAELLSFGLHVIAEKK